MCKENKQCGAHSNITMLTEVWQAGRQQQQKMKRLTSWKLSVSVCVWEREQSKAKQMKTRTLINMATVKITELISIRSSIHLINVHTLGPVCANARAHAFCKAQSATASAHTYQLCCSSFRMRPKTSMHHRMHNNNERAQSYRELERWRDLWRFFFPSCFSILLLLYLSIFALLFLKICRWSNGVCRLPLLLLCTKHRPSTATIRRQKQILYAQIHLKYVCCLYLLWPRLQIYCACYLLLTKQIGIASTDSARARWWDS